MKILSQRDPAWGGKTIGKSSSLIKDYGCTITGISMLSDWYGCFKDPGWMAKNLSFLRDLVIWQSIEKVLCFKFVWRYYKLNEEKLLEALKGKDTSALIQVKQVHWVVGIRKIGNYYWIADPWDGKRRLLHKSAISGFATFIKS